MFTLTDEQQSISDAIYDRENDFSVLMGAAGTGKTTVATDIMNKYAGDLRTGRRILTIAPTLQALENVRKRTKTRNTIFKTVASLLSTPVKVLSIMQQKFPIDTSDELEKVAQFLENLKIDSSIIINYNYGLLYQGALEEALDIKYGVGTSMRKLFDFKVGVEFKTREASQVAALLMKDEVQFLIVDEASMINKLQFNVLMDAVNECRTMGHDITMLICGDPYQLEPVEGELNDYMQPYRVGQDDGFFILNTVMRSSDKVIEIATKVKDGEKVSKLIRKYPLNLYSTGNIESIGKNPALTRRLLNADVVLSFQNKNVNALNEFIRTELGYTGIVSPGEKLVSMSNVFGQTDLISSFYNSELFKVEKVLTGQDAWLKLLETFSFNESEFATSKLHDALVRRNSLVYAYVRSEVTGETKECVMEAMNRWLKTVDRNDISELLLTANVRAQRVPFVRMNLGYAMTVHKSQGSEWDNIVYYLTSKDEWIVKKPNLSYTALTRAKKNVEVFFSNEFNN